MTVAVQVCVVPVGFDAVPGVRLMYALTNVFVAGAAVVTEIGRPPSVPVDDAFPTTWPGTRPT